MKENNINKVVRVSTKYHWFHINHFLTGCKGIISRESAQGELRTIRLIPRDVLNYCNQMISIEFESIGTYFHWVHPTQYFDGIQGNYLNKVIPRCTKDHWVHPYSFYIYMNVLAVF